MSDGEVGSAASVIIPTYNASTFIHETVRSVFAQTLRAHELIVVDDASTDGTPDIVRALATGAPVPVRVIERDGNSGTPVEPLNVGIQATDAEYIAVLDQDDR